MILGFMFIGVPVALAFLAANMIGATYFMGGNGDLLTQMAMEISLIQAKVVATIWTLSSRLGAM